MSILKLLLETQGRRFKKLSIFEGVLGLFELTGTESLLIETEFYLPSTRPFHWTFTDCIELCTH